MQRPELSERPERSERPASQEGLIDHVVDLVDDYLLGALSPDELDAVETHVFRCEACRAQYDAFGNAAVAVALLPDGVVHELEGRAREPSAPAVPRSRLRLVAAFAGVLLLGAVLGIGGWIVAMPDGLRGTPAGSETAEIGTARLSATVTDRADGGADVRAVAVGLRPGQPFELLVVADDGRAYVAAHGVTSGGPQAIVGQVPVTAAQIQFLAIVAGDGAQLLVTRHLP